MKQFILLALFICCVAGCKSSTEPAVQPIGAPTNITVQTVNASSVLVSWTRAKNDTKTDTVIVLTQNTFVKAVVVVAPDTMAIVTGLQTGIPYTITLHSANASSPSV